MTSDAATSNVLVRAGDTVRCMNGHQICEAASDIVSGDSMRVHQFKNWFCMPEPKEEERTPSCPWCGVPVFPLNDADGTAVIFTDREITA